MAIVLMIAGVLISAAITIGSAQIASSRITATKEKQTAIKSALMTFVLRNNRVPCPAVPGLTEADAGYGYEAADAGVCTNVPSSGGVSVGTIPWRSLGISNEGVDDGYYNRFTYAVTTTQTNLNANTVSGMRGNITIHSSAPAGLANQLNNCIPAGWTYNPCAAVVVILSHGVFGRGAYTNSGLRLDLPGASDPDELENADNDGVFIDRQFSDNAENAFNDIVLALDPDDLLLPLINSGAVKDYKAQVKRDYSLIVGAVATDALANRSGFLPGLRNYPLSATLAALNLPADVTTDPWGMAYIYNRVTATISSSTGNNTAFTITSYGPDSVSGGGDDIVETVMVSDMQSLFSTYGW
jgi:type II secretory pathway pseudopilin PulG